MPRRSRLKVSKLIGVSLNTVFVLLFAATCSFAQDAGKDLIAVDFEEIADGGNVEITSENDLPDIEAKVYKKPLNLSNHDKRFKDPGQNIITIVVSPSGHKRNHTRDRSSEIEGLLVEDAVVEYGNLCATGSPLRFGDDVTLCSLDKPCPIEYWCHFGSTRPTTFCCPGAKVDSGCFDKKIIGHGSGAMSRWYFDILSNTCKMFKYTGYGGNQNNFLTKEMCQQNCGVITGDFKLSQDLSPLPLNIDWTMPTSCFEQGASAGTGSGKWTRWYFDTKEQRCYPFSYTGSGGSMNNFVTLWECEITCRVSLNSTHAIIAKPTDQPNLVIKKEETTTQPTQTRQIERQQPQLANPCVQIVTQGVGNQPIVRWYFNSISQQCVQFSFLGQGGNNNNFASQNDCRDACGTALNIDRSVCLQTQNVGAGEFRIPRWSWDPSLGRCINFFYLGCCGNSNRFPTQTMCEQVCQTPTTQQPITIPITNPPTVPLNTNPCFQPIDQGTGNQPRSRFYFDFTRGVCVQFTYLGNGGNLNNFASAFACQSSCAQQPTVTPAPALSICQNGNPNPTQYCSSITNFTCPGNTYCHVGTGVDTTICCPSQSNNPCEQPLAEGRGNAVLQRFYYNRQTGRCQSFVYKGVMGNQNNFQTYDQCTQRCGVNPCTRGSPYALSGQFIQCSSIQQGICPVNYFCHIGPDSATTVCCPRTGEDRCNLPILTGNGQGQLQRWAFNARTKRCESFIYTGLQGNENNFMTEANCKGTCPVEENPCGNGEPATVQGTTNILRCSVNNMNVCPSSFYCHIGAGSATTVCCRISSSNPCQLPLATGTGNAVLSRWYFDTGSSTCKAFTYTGITGNENNFLGLADCRRVCPEYDNPCASGAPPTNVATGQIRFCSQANPTCPATFWCHLGNTRQTTVCCPNAADPCTQAMNSGSGANQLPRWYYDTTNRVCRQFTYSGKAGNQNNFLSLAECESTCPVLDNPCAQGMPSLTSIGNPLLCSTSNVDVCPPTFWCHIGFNAATTLCCPGAADPCRLPLSRGTGTSVLNRWYYNTDTQTCLSYTYTGRGGNQNNFLSLAECRLRCPEFQNPCSTGQPHIGLTGQITHCGATTPSICPTTYWCHVGATLDTSVCCPGAGNPCELPLAGGNGNANLLRYYYDAAIQTCRQFQYTGMGGNQNDFMTQNDCERRCPVFHNPCGDGEPARNTNGQIVPCSVSNLNGCANNFWCHVGSDEQTTLCCPTTGVNTCRQSLQVGTGSAALRRHYYNALTQQCLPFTYSGIGGNQNNFLSRADCESTCPVFANPCAAGDPATGPNGQYLLCTATSPNVCPANFWCHIGDLNTNSVCCPGAENACLLPPATGNGNAALPRFYFDTNVRRCTRFTYTGMGGNQNNYLSLQDCQLACPEFQNPCQAGDPGQSPQGGILFCSVRSQTCPGSYWCHVGVSDESTVCCPGASDPCLQSLVPGIGSSRLVRWYFNQNTRQCLQFTYTGLAGNQNNFMSEQECVNRCPVFQNPCGSTVNPPQILYCSAQNLNVCPSGYWCHVGLNTQTSVCCPGSSDPCTLSNGRGTGVGGATVTRWFFDRADRTCKQFAYTGIGGNENNFQTQLQCQQKCPEFSNPCVDGAPYREAVNGLVKFCNRGVPNDCPAQFWCHVGATQQTTVCCPGIGDPCTMTVATGSGPASLTRWYFNQVTRQCQQYTYRGLGGNRNNFQTQRECQQNCPEFTNPCGNGTPLTAVSGQVTYCTQSNPQICPPTYFCHYGTRQESTVCCPGSGNPCNLPQSIGQGSASLQRYFFNQISRRCESFVYTGIRGNANNFLTQQSCRALCPEFNNPCNGQPYSSAGGQLLYCNSDSVCPSNFYCHYGEDTVTTLCCPISGDPCSLPVVIGRGDAQLTRYYYNSAIRSCVSYVYSGIGGNENNFRTQPECQARCQPSANPCAGGQQPYQDNSGRNVQCGSSTGLLAQVCPSSYFCHVGADVWNTVCCPLPAGNICEFSMVVGSSSGNLQRWYFNPSIQRCQLFTYNGIGGNANNFLSEEDCQRQCTSVQVNTGPCPQGEPLLEASGLRRTCDVAQPNCPSTYICNLQPAQATSNAICCPDPRYFCLQPRDTGGLNCPAFSSVTRYGYNPATDTCVPYAYNGCGGNLNNFFTLQSCTRVCCNKGYNQQAGRQLAQRVFRDDATVSNGTEVDGDESTEERELHRSKRTWWSWLRSIFR